MTRRAAIGLGWLALLLATQACAQVLGYDEHYDRGPGGGGSGGSSGNGAGGESGGGGSLCPTGSPDAGPPSPLVCGVGACHLLLEPCAANGEPATCPPPSAADVDTCGNGLDDDCDGSVDENDSGSCTCGGPGEATQKRCYTGSPETRRKGLCRDGQQQCEAGTWGPCEFDVLPAPEIADGFDNDCDGSVDEGLPCEGTDPQPCYGGSDDTRGVGACKDGEHSCVGGTWGACTGQVLAGLEVCDGLDNDCDHVVDDGVPGVGDECFSAEYVNTPCHPGTMKCPIGGPVPECTPNVAPGSMAETCNGIDDDCNGNVDDGAFCCTGDGKKSGNETDLDCGGSCAQKCGDGKGCAVGGDCVSGVCMGPTCAVPTCVDGVKNGLETDLDCGAPSCPNKCALDQGCDVDGNCASNVCDMGTKKCTQKIVGATCLQDIECASSFCRDGACCDTSCTGTCVACNVMGNVGTCTPIAANADPSNECNPGSCDGQGQCQKINGASCIQNTQCVSGNCVDGVCCNTTCNGTCVACDVAGSVGTCANVPANTDPGNECPLQECNGSGACEYSDGEACLADADCQSGFCVDGFCCQTACSGMCEACSLGKTGSPNGTCAPIAPNTDPDAECPGGECNGSGACELPLGVVCNVNADCQSGACSDGVCCNVACSGGCQACNLAGFEGTCTSHLANTDPENACATECNGNGVCELADGTVCMAGSDCQSGVCNVTCQAPTCYDMVQNGNETAVDCGGACGPCRLILAASDSTNIVVGEFNADNVSPTWMLWLKTGYMSGAPGIAMTNTGFGVVAIRDDSNGSKLSSLTWSAAGGFGASFATVGAGSVIDTTPRLKPVGLTSQVIAAFHMTSSGPVYNIRFGQVDASTGTWSLSNEGVTTLTDPSSAIVPDIVDLAATTPYVVYTDGGGTENLAFRQRSGLNNWTTTGTIDADVSHVPQPVITRLKDNRLLVVFTDSDGNLKSHLRSAAGTWGALSATIGTSSYRPSLTSLADGKAMVAWIDAIGNAVVSTFDPSAGTWSVPVNVSGAATTGGIVSLTRGLNGKVAELLYLLNNASKDLIHARYDGTTWTKTTIPGAGKRADHALAAPPLP